MVERITRPSEQAIENSRLVLEEVPPDIQADINPVAQLICALHIGADQYGKPFTGEEKEQLRKTQHALLKKLTKQYPDLPVTNISDALAVMSQI